jgi:hypothetical protein
MTSLIFRMDSLLGRQASSFFRGGSLAIVISSAALPVEIIPNHRESHSGIQRKTIRRPVGITVRLQAGIVFVFTPERFSRSPRNPVRLAPDPQQAPS